MSVQIAVISSKTISLIPAPRKAFYRYAIAGRAGFEPARIIATPLINQSQYHHH